MFVIIRLLLCAGILLPALDAKRILYVTHTAGYRHDSIAASIRTMIEVAQRTGVLEITATEDLSLLNAENLAGYDALFFFTSGELALSDQQKNDLLEFVRSGKGFGGAHSATDTFYTWPDYGEMIGGIFDGHPWAQDARIVVEAADFPGLQKLMPGFRFVEEFYQFRSFSREKVRVLLSLDATTVDLTKEGVNRADGDFALAWVRRYGLGRVFYTALGHFDESWEDKNFQQILEGALLWLTGEVEADATPVQSSDSAALRASFITVSGAGRPVHISKPMAPW